MNADEWIFQCAGRLHRQWPRVDFSDLEHLAGALLAEERWRCLTPADAAMQWLEQGIPQSPPQDTQERPQDPPQAFQPRAQQTEIQEVQGAP